MTKAEAEEKAWRLSAGGTPTAVRWQARDGYVTASVAAYQRYERSAKGRARRDRYRATIRGQTSAALSSVRYRARRRTS